MLKNMSIDGSLNVVTIVLVVLCIFILSGMSIMSLVGIRELIADPTSDNLEMAIQRSDGIMGAILVVSAFLIVFVLGAGSVATASITSPLNRLHNALQEGTKQLRYVTEHFEANPEDPHGFEVMKAHVDELSETVEELAGTIHGKRDREERLTVIPAGGIPFDPTDDPRPVMCVNWP
ncbi:hypothetical protein ACFL1X_11105 [Candidatus Hydrogenedentota bacterium]